MKKLLTFLTLLTLFFGVGWAETSTLTFTAKCNGSGTADDGVSWTVTSDGTESTFDDTKGIHYGTGSSAVQYIKLTTSGISGTITSVVVNASTASGVSATASVTVGGNAFGGDAQSISTTATNYTFNGSASGEIIVTVTKPSHATKALYVKSVAVTYTPGSSSATHNITYAEVTGGSFSGPASAAEGAEVTIQATPADGYNFGSWNVTDASGAITVTDNKFTMGTSDVTVSGTFVVKPTYTISVTNGSADLTTAYEGQTVTLTPNIPSGQVVDWDATTVSPSSVVIDHSNYTFTMPGQAVTVEFAFKDNPAGSAIFYESWSGTSGTGGNDGSWSGSIASGEVVSDLTGWTYENESGASSCVKLGTSKKQGTATTPAITVNNNSVYVLTFKAGAWDGNTEQTDLMLSATGGELYADEDCTTPLTSVSMTKGAWSDYTVYVKSTSSSLKVTWAGKYASNSRFFLDEVMLIPTGAAPQPSVATPVITGDTPFDETTTVTITCDAEGSTVYYTTDGTEPDNTSTQYTAAFTLDASATVKAIAYVGETASQVATKEFVKNPSVASIAEMLAYEGTGEFKFTGDVVVTYFNSTNSQYVWVKDATGYSLLYNSNLSNADPAPKTGDVIKGGWKGKKSVYNKLIEVTNVTTAFIDGTQEVTPAELTLADVIVDKQATYGWLRGVTITEVNNRNFTISDGENTVRGYNTYNTDENINLPEANDGKTYDIRGIVNVYNNPQFTPVEIVERVSVADGYYLFGQFNSWDTDDSNYKFTQQSDGSYVLVVSNYSANNQFKFAKYENGTATLIGVSNGGNNYGLHSTHHTGIAMNTGDDTYSINDSGEMIFTIHADETAFDVDKQVYMKGTYNSWANEAMTLTADGWKITKHLAANTELGFQDTWGNGIWHGCGDNQQNITVDASKLGTDLALWTDGKNFVMESDANYTFVVSRDLSKVVITRPYIVTCTAITDIEGKTGGTVTADKETANPGETVTLTINTNSGYTLDRVIVNSNDITPVEGVYSFTMPQADAEVKAYFTTNVYTITVDNDNTMGAVVGLQSTAHTGETVEFEVSPVEGYTIKSVTASFINANNVETAVPVTENNGVYSFGMPPFNVTVKVTYKAPIAPCTIPFTETWGQTAGQGGNDGSWSGISTTTAAIADHEGWIYTRQDGAEFQGFGASACLRVGDRNEEGAATTPDIIVTNGTIYEMTFNAGSWDNNVAINFSATGATLFADEDCTTPISTLDIAYREWGEYTVYVKATSNLMNITFATPAYKRFFLDDVNIDYFATPEIIETTLAVLCKNGVPGKTYTISDVEGLLGVYSQRTSVWFKDEAQAVDYQEPQASDKDYAIVVDENDLKINKNQKEFAQNNWIEVVFPAEADYNNKYVKNLTGTYSNVNGNPVLTLTQAVAEEDVTPVPATALAYEPNPYIAANFVGNQKYQGDTYFFSMPKAQEYAQILWAVWDGSKMNMPTDNNVYGFTGSFTIEDDLNISNFDGLQNGSAYNFHAIIRKGAATTTGAPMLKGTGDTYVVYPTDLNPQIPTAINGVSVNGEVKSVKYVNVAGIMSDTPFEGVNIVVTEYTDGSRSTTKMLRK